METKGNRLEITRFGNFTVGKDGDLVLRTNVWTYDTINGRGTRLVNQTEFHFDINSDYDGACAYFEEVISGFYHWDLLTFDENIFENEMVDDQMVESFLTFATGLNALNRQ